MSVLFSAFSRLNADYTLVKRQTLDESRSYRPILRLSESLFPFVERMYERITFQNDNRPTDE